MNQALPSNTQTAATDAVDDCKNLGLLLDKFAPWMERDGEWNLWMETTARRPWVSGSGAKGVWLRESPGNAVSSVLRPSSHRDTDLIVRALARWRAMVGAQGAAPFEMKVDYRLVVGFGAEHVLETNLCLHRIYGFPIIPGSAVKGVTRAWAFWQIAEQLALAPDKLQLRILERLLSEGDKREQMQLWDELQLQPARNFTHWQSLSREFYGVFGTTERQGQVVFFDAYPRDPQRLKLELDIINPHYGPYYSDPQGRTPPADYLDPSPTYFLTVAMGTPFQFAVASKVSAWADKAQEWLKDALTDIGIGGKTSAGYGFMTSNTGASAQSPDATNG